MTTNVSEQVVIPQSAVPVAPTPPTPPEGGVPPEIAYLRQHGMESEATSLAGELESLLRSQPPAPAPVAASPAPVPAAPTPVPNQPAPAPQTAQERALDPYAPDGPKTEPEFSDDDFPGVTIDAEGRARDAATGKYVPIKALHKERAAAKDLRAENAKLREEHTRATERLAILQEMLNGDDTAPSAPAEPSAPQPPVEPTADPEQDIFLWAKQQQEYLKANKAYIESLEQKLAGNEQLTKAQLGELAMQQKIRQDITSYNAKNPHFFQAYNHLRQTRDNALLALGYTDKAAREAQLSREERGLAQQAVNEGRSYGELLYSVAKAYGFAEPQATPAPTPEPAPAPAPSVPTTPAIDPTAAAHVQALQRAKDQAGPSLNGQGGAPGEGITVSRLASMSEAEFLDLAAKLGGKAKMDSYFRGI